MASTGAPKRSLFNKPTWATKTVPKHLNENISIFGQNDVYEDIVAAERKRREKHIARTKERAEKERSKNQKQAIQVGHTKRRRISDHKDEEDVESDSDSDNRSLRSESQGSGGSQSKKKSVTPEVSESIVKTIPSKDRKQLSVNVSEPHVATVVIDDDSDYEEPAARDRNDDVHTSRRKLRSKQKARLVESNSESEEENEYLRELKRAARDEARLKKLGIEVGRDNSPDSNNPSTSINPRSPSQGPFASHQTSNDSTRSLRATSTPSHDLAADPEVHIRIISIMPGTSELFVTRRLSQPLDKVKQFWCQHFDLPPALAWKVFFTWNGTRLYNSTTMRSIVERLKQIRPMPDGSDPSGGKIEIEAMTDEILDYRRRQKERRRNENAGLVSAGDDQEKPGNLQPDIADSASNPLSPPAESAAQEQPKEKPGTIIKLKAEGTEEIALRVRPNTTVAKIVAGFRRLRNVDRDKQCWLMYDGERLQNEQTAEEIGFESDDGVEVYLR